MDPLGGMTTMSRRLLGLLGASVLGCVLLLRCGLGGGGGAPSRTAGADTVFAEDFEAGNLAAWQDGSGSSASPDR